MGFSANGSGDGLVRRHAVSGGVDDPRQQQARHQHHHGQRVQHAYKAPEPAVAQHEEHGVANAANVPPVHQRNVDQRPHALGDRPKAPRTAGRKTLATWVETGWRRRPQRCC